MDDDDDEEGEGVGNAYKLDDIDDLWSINNLMNNHLNSHSLSMINEFSNLIDNPMKFLKSF